MGYMGPLQLCWNVTHAKYCELHPEVSSFVHPRIFFVDYIALLIPQNREYEVPSTSKVNWFEDLRICLGSMNFWAFIKPLFILHILLDPLFRVHYPLWGMWTVDISFMYCKYLLDQVFPRKTWNRADAWSSMFWSVQKLGICTTAHYWESSNQPSQFGVYTAP